MNRMPTRLDAAMVAVVIFAMATPLWAWDPANPNDPAADTAAKAALRALGPDRGSMTLAADTRTLVSDVRDVARVGLGLKAGAEDLDTAIKGLGATVTDTEIQVQVSSDLLFDFDKADVRPKAEAELARLAAVIQKSRQGLVLINGHTDSVGGDEYNQRLSERRAEAIKTWMVTKAGIPAEVVKTKGCGKSKPIAPNTGPGGSDNPDGRAKNRRVEVIIQKSGKLP